MKNTSEGSAEFPQDSAPEPKTELPHWSSPHSTTLEAFEALLEAAERIAKPSRSVGPETKLLAARAIGSADRGL